MHVAIIGDGPGGLSAALLLAKNGLKATVYGEDNTAMHWALLKNYLGIPEIPGTEFQKIARKQVTDLGGEIIAARVESVTRQNDGFEVTLADGQKVQARFLVLSEGKSPRLAKQLGLEFDDKSGVQTDINGRTKIDGAYAVGRLARPARSQAIISAGDGAAVAIDILSTVKGEAFVDWDSPPEEKK